MVEQNLSGRYKKFLYIRKTWFKDKIICMFLIIIGN